VYELGLLYLGVEGEYSGDPNPDCAAAVQILNHRAVDGSKKSHANDAAYKLARSLLAYELNQDAGACFSAEAAADAAEAHTLLSAIGFDGTGNNYLRPKDGDDYYTALDLHGTLDEYNNGGFCP
jgi:hypothetical protein